MYFTVALAAERCYRSPRLILDMISKYGLPVKTGWLTRRRLHRRVHLLKPSVVTWMVDVTLLGNKDARQRPPR
jgi:hypothetical protein